MRKGFCFDILDKTSHSQTVGQRRRRKSEVLLKMFIAQLFVCKSKHDGFSKQQVRQKFKIFLINTCFFSDLAKIALLQEKIMYYLETVDSIML